MPGSGAWPWATKAEGEQGRDMPVPRCVFGKTSGGGVEGNGLEVRVQEEAGGSPKTYLSTEAGEVGSLS